MSTTTTDTNDTHDTTDIEQVTADAAATPAPREKQQDDATTPGKTFEELGVEKILADALADKGITHAFPIQELTLPLAIGGADIIGQARTGTGKTLGFGLPLLSRIDVDKAQTQALVVVPTRELCIQVAADLQIGAARGVRVQSVYGGVPYEEQIEALTTGVHVVVGTPGRTLDHLEKRNLDLSGVHIVVLDEADEMLDMGFLPDVERLLRDCPDERQTMLFSATMPKAVVKLARRFMETPTFMQADTEAHETAPNVAQHFFIVHRMDKPRVLARIMQTPGRGGAFVFCRTKRMCDRLVEDLEGLGINAIAVHGDLRQSSREKNLDKFRDGKADVLVATEVAARGLDVSNVTHVINYDCPDDQKMYLHRIGRTARAGEEGVAVTFADFSEMDRVNVIRKKVDVDNELIEIFSTSDELTEMFGLPTETPWAHLSKKKTGGTGQRRSSSSGSGSRSSNKDQSRGGRDGGSGRGSRSSKRDGGGDDNRSSRSKDEGSSRSERSSSSKSTSTRSRERTRTRTRDTGDDNSSSSPSSSSSSSSSSSMGESSSGSGTASRARSRSRRQTTSDDSSSSRSSNRDGGGRSSSSDKGRSDRASGRGGNSSSRNANRNQSDDSTSGSNSSASSRRERTTSRGDEARGEGTPRHSRRVEVENLP